MTDPDTIITTMAQQREQERAADAAHAKLRKACQGLAVELYDALHWLVNGSGPYVNAQALLKEIDDATQ